MDQNELVFLKSLSKQFPTIASASTEIINLQSILALPKGTEHFITDIHGEYEQFNHVMKNGSGAVRRKIDEEFGNTISEHDKRLPPSYTIPRRSWKSFRRRRSSWRTGIRLPFTDWCR